MVETDGSHVARTLSAKMTARLPTALLRPDYIAAAGFAASLLLAAASGAFGVARRKRRSAGGNSRGRLHRLSPAA